jgi:hypothetical protein
MIPISSLSTKVQKDKVIRRLTSYFLLPNLTVMSDHRSPNGISSIDSIPIRDFLGPCTLTSSFQVLDDVFKEGISMGRFTQGTI